MQSKTIRGVMVVTALYLALSACNESEHGKGWEIFSEAVEQEMKQSSKKISISNLIELFLNKHILMTELVTMCQNNPAIRRVGLKDEAVSFYGAGNSSSDYKLIIETTKSLLSEVSALSIDCGRRGDFEEKPLAVVSLVMYASGLSVSGTSLGFVYRTNWSRINNPITEEQIKSRGYTELDKYGWYVYKK